MIYSREDDSLADCEYLTERKFVRQFVTKFHDEVSQAERARNLTAGSTSYYEPESKHYAQKFRHLLKSDVEPEESEGSEYSGPDAFGMRNITFRRLFSESDIPLDLQDITDVDVLKQQCDDRHSQMERLLTDLNSDDQSERQNATDHLTR